MDGRDEKKFPETRYLAQIVKSICRKIFHDQT